jgi:biopolymer transport protein TolR
MPRLQPADAGSSGSRGRGRRVSTSLAEINVVPLVDVMLVLLIIFMVTAPMIQRGIDVNLPVSRTAPEITAERVEVIVPANYSRTKTVYLGAELVKASVLQELVRQKMEHAVKKDVFLRGDRLVNLGEVMEVADMLKRAGVQNVGLETRTPTER